MSDDLARSARRRDELEPAAGHGDVDKCDVSRDDLEPGLGKRCERPRAEPRGQREGRLGERADLARVREQPPAEETHGSEASADPDEREDPEAVPADAQDGLAKDVFGGLPQCGGFDRGKQGGPDAGFRAEERPGHPDDRDGNDGR